MYAYYQVADRRILVVLDNAVSEDQVMPLLPGSPSCSVMMTSQRRLLGLSSAHHVSLKPLSMEDSVKLITASIGRARVRAEPAVTVDFGVDLPGLRVLVEDVPPPFARSELSFGIVPARDPRHGYETWAEFTTDLWDPATVDGWLRHYGTILMLACGAPEEPLGQLLATIRKTLEGPDNYLLTESSCQIGRRRRSP